MINLIILVVLALIVWNAVRSVSRVMKSIKSQRCTGDCSTCKTPCQIKLHYYKDAPEDGK